MIYEYAVDPALITTEEKAVFLLESFGLDKGRLVSELKSKQWQRLALDTIREFGGGPVARKRLKEALVMLLRQKAFYIRQQNAGGGSWLSLAQSAHSAWPYRGILMESYDGLEEHYLVKDIQLSQNDKWAIPASVTVDRDANNMLEAVKPLLTNAREVVLVDRNFRLTNHRGSPMGRFKNVLLKIVDFLANKPYGPSVRKLTYHIGDEHYSESNLSSELNGFVASHLPSNFKLEFSIWPKGELHDRYLLTNIGSLDCGIGLDEFSGSSDRTVTYKRLSKVDHSTFWSKFHQERPVVSVGS
ncbi:MAG: hypothetical protein ACI8PB_004398 [Desulforhopalus sp.]|jgi:hypothetical protein